MKELHVSNVPYAATEDDLKEVFKSITAPDAIHSCELVRPNFQRAHKGYGFVTFFDEETADELHITANYRSIMLLGRVLRVNPSKRFVPHNAKRSTEALGASALSMGYLSDRDTFHVLWSTERGLETEFDFREKKLLVKFDVNYSAAVSSEVDIKLEFRFPNIRHAYSAEYVDYPIRGRTLVLEVQNPPNVFELKRSNLEDLFSSLMYVTGQHDYPTAQAWVRAVDFTPERSIGQSFAYVLDFPESARAPLAKICGYLGEFQFFRNVGRLLRRNSASSYAETDVLVPLLKCPANVRIPFEIMFALDELVQTGTLSPLCFTTGFFQLLSRLFERTETRHLPYRNEQVLSLVKDLLITAESPFMNLEQWLWTELQKVRSGARVLRTSATIRPGDGVIKVRRLMVTPTMVYCVGPELETSNRVTREFIHVIDNFIRVSFMDEDGWHLSSQALTDMKDNQANRGNSPVCDRILRILKEGIRLHGKHYEFLAFSSSQLREQSVWMFAQTEDVTPWSIREWMGDFLSIKNVAKCAARMGQCFSSTTKTLPVEESEVRQIDDIMSTDRRYCFSDGIGRISVSFANQVAGKCGRLGAVPSAFQIRYGGYKGVVAVDPNIDRTSEDKLWLRPSMSKFHSPHPDLEVISWTKPLPCYLNRQIITLLSTLGVRDRAFERLQDGVLRTLEDVVSNVAVALGMLQVTGYSASHQVSKAMLRAGYQPNEEPYLKSLLQAFRAFQLLQLRTKARILVQKGRTMMGCLDETGILHYGEVYVQVSNFPGIRDSDVLDDGLEYDENGRAVVVGEVVVAKNPCLHPGDVRVLTAVDVPELHHMVDCVVFPKRGPRPHPNECSGSDLDGDLYFISWDRRLIPEQMDEPMDYTPARTITLARPVSIEDIQDFFVRYMKSDALGIISNAHVVHADCGRERARSVKCKELARLFMVAVDFPKTGEQAVMDSSLRPDAYPDYMEKDDTKRTYESTTILGTLFRTVVGKATMGRLVSTFTRDEISRSFDSDLIWHGFQEYVPDAEVLKSWYDAKLMGLMNQYGIQTEAEAVSGNILPLSKFYMKKQGEVIERIKLAVQNLQSEFRRYFKHGFDGEVIDESDTALDEIGEEQKRFAKASAWYHVTYHREYMLQPQSGGYNHIYLLSFPWVVYETLLEVKRRNQRV